MRQFLGAIEPMKIAVTICSELRQVPFKMVGINVIEIGNVTFYFLMTKHLEPNSSKKGSILNG